MFLINPNPSINFWRNYLNISCSNSQRISSQKIPNEGILLYNLGGIVREMFKIIPVRNWRNSWSKFWIRIHLDRFFERSRRGISRGIYGLLFPPRISPNNFKKLFLYFYQKFFQNFFEDIPPDILLKISWSILANALRGTQHMIYCLFLETPSFLKFLWIYF